MQLRPSLVSTIRTGLTWLAIAASSSFAVMNGHGVSGPGTLESAIPLEQKTLLVRMSGSYWAGDQLGLTDASGKKLSSSGDAYRSEYVGQVLYGIAEYWELGLSMPFYRDAYSNGSEYQGIGDLRTSIKLNYPPYPHKKGFEMALLLQVDAPTSADEDGGYARHAWYLESGADNEKDAMTRNAFGAKGVAVSTRMLTTANFGAIDGMFPLLLHLNWGATFTGSGSQNAFTLGGGVEATPHPLVTAFWSFYSEVFISGATKSIPLFSYPYQSTAGLQFNIPKANLEVWGGVDFVVNRYTDKLYTADDGASASAPSYERVPRLGFSGGLTGRFSFAPKDKDKDGILDRVDRCPDAPEDMDHFQDEDGCPDIDNDHDGIKDVQDSCPDKPEDVDGFQDEDGCPDLDNDKDGIADAEDRCPNDAEDMDKFEDEDGCPDLDNDKDGIPDTQDKCVDRPEDVDGFQDEDGCPDLDNDGDGVPDKVDRCPMEPETLNGVNDSDGCPD